MKTIQRLTLVAFLPVLVAHAGELTWTARTVVPDRRTGAGPALTVFDGKLLLIYKGETSGGLYYTTLDGEYWSPETRIPKIESRDTPALAVVGDTLHCIYVGEKGKSLYDSRYRDGRWLPEAKIEGRESKAGPALAVVGKTIHMVRLGGGSSHLYYETFDGVRWSPEQKLGGCDSRARPALAVVGKTLHLCYLEDKDSSRAGYRIYHAMLRDGRWTQPAQIGGVTSDEAPALVVRNDRLMLFRVRDRKLGYAEFDGRTWGAARDIPGQDGRYAPGVTFVDGAQPALHLAYVDKKKHYMWHSMGYDR